MITNLGLTKKRNLSKLYVDKARFFVAFQQIIKTTYCKDAFKSFAPNHTNIFSIYLTIGYRWIDDSTTQTCKIFQQNTIMLYVAMIISVLASLKIFSKIWIVVGLPIYVYSISIMQHSMQINTPPLVKF